MLWLTFLGLAVLKLPCELFLQGSTTFIKVSYCVTMFLIKVVHDLEELVLVVLILLPAVFVYTDEVALALAILLLRRA